MKMEGNTVLITGGGSGVGFALAKALLELNNTVIIVGRDEAKLLQAKNKFPGLHAVKCDISRDSERINLVSKLRLQFPKLNMLINNAAIASFSELRDENFYDNIVKEMDTNFLAPLRLMQLFLDHLRNQPCSAIVNIGSPAAFMPMTLMPGYSASKAALHSISQSLRYQLSDTKIQVIEVLLPPVDTQMVLDFKLEKLSPDRVGYDIISGLKKGRVFIPVGEVGILLWIFRFFPRAISVLANRMVSNALNK